MNGFYFFWFCLTSLVSKNEKFNFWDCNNCNNDWKIYQPEYMRKFIKYSLKPVVVKALLSLNVFKMLLFKGRLILWPARRVSGSERVNVFAFIETSLILFLKSGGTAGLFESYLHSYWITCVTMFPLNFEICFSRTYL